jgi:uncharacterized protein YbbK (DUF523 family)
MPTSPHSTERTPLLVGVSACLLGAAVRYDGGHKYEPAVARSLAETFVLVPVCPEVELGLGVPRETVRLVLRAGEVRMIASRTGTDHTDDMRAFARRRVRELEALGLSGYVFKKDSPSCGVVGVEVVGAPDAGRGMFADELTKRMPELPVEEEASLRDADAYADFVCRVLAYGTALRERAKA